MQIMTGVRDFGKIEYAEVDMDSFSVFVGNNNSGKTYMMQLIYGLRKNLRKYVHNYQSDHLAQIRKEADNGKVLLDAAMAKELEKFLNEILEKNKEKIVRSIFNENISIGRLYVKFLFDEEEKMEYLLFNSEEKKVLLDEIKKNLYMNEKRRQLVLENLNDLSAEERNWYTILIVNHIQKGRRETESVMSTIALDEFQPFHIIIREMLKLFMVDSRRILFMPASRTGLLMLYKEYFAHKADEAVQLLGGDNIENNDAVNIGLTQPVYEFIRFMQTFQSDLGAAKRNESLICFMEKHLIEGKVYQNQGNQALYQGKDTEKGIPLYLSSSMVNELTPALYALQSASQKDYLIWDEIETSLHPQKQMELVRLLSRMSNHGVRLIVSMHSDTMATKINNLCMLSYSKNLKEKQAEILEKVGLEPEDLLQKRIHIYQFTNDESGKSHATELLYNEFTGYEFSQFHDSVSKLFQETKLIME